MARGGGLRESPVFLSPRAVVSRVRGSRGDAVRRCSVPLAPTRACVRAYRQIGGIRTAHHEHRSQRGLPFPLSILPKWSPSWWLGHGISALLGAMWIALVAAAIVTGARQALTAPRHGARASGLPLRLAQSERRCDDAIPESRRPPARHGTRGSTRGQSPGLGPAPPTLMFADEGQPSHRSSLSRDGVILPDRRRRPRRLGRRRAMGGERPVGRDARPPSRTG